jgi:hypothetical protein
MYLGNYFTVPARANLPGQRSTGGGGSAFEYTAIDNSFSMEFDGNDTYIDAGFLQPLSQVTNYTISMWIKPSQVPPANTQAVFSFYQSNGGRIEIYPGASNLITFVNSSNNSLSSTNAAFPAQTPANGWYHIALVYDGTFTDPDPVLQNQGRIKPYVNAVYTAAGVSGTQQATSQNYTGKRATIGARSINYATPTLDFDGHIDEFAIFSASLTAERIQNIYDATVNNPGKVADLSETPEGAPAVWYRMGD